jgi:HKD family nuclease
MEIKFHIQDPTADVAVYLIEAFLDSVAKSTQATGVFAFASKNGVDSLLLDPVVKSFLVRHRFLLVVGIDAVTNRSTLERLLEHQQHYRNLDVRVFWNPVSALFHPKMATFELVTGGRQMIVGSGNLTPGGFRNNFEAFSVISAAPSDEVDFSDWDSFFVRHASNFRAIDEEVLQRASKNIILTRRKKGVRVQEPIVIETDESPVSNVTPSDTEFLVAQVPAASGRWHQIHFNAEVIHSFLRITANSSERLFLNAVDIDGARSEQEVRPCVYSQHNKNYKVEIGARRELPYPSSGRPILIMKKVALRTFEYMLIMPREAGHDILLNITETLANVGKGLPRVITDATTIRARWDSCPLLQA